MTSSARRTRRCLKRNSSHLLRSSDLHQWADEKRVAVISALQLRTLRSWCIENNFVFCTVTSCAKKLMWREQRLSSAWWLLVPRNWCEENSGYLLHCDFLCQETDVKRTAVIFCTVTSCAKKLMWRERRLSSARWLLVPRNWCEENGGYLLHGDFLCQEANVKNNNMPAHDVFLCQENDVKKIAIVQNYFFCQEVGVKKIAVVFCMVLMPRSWCEENGGCLLHGSYASKLM